MDKGTALLIISAVNWTPSIIVFDLYGANGGLQIEADFQVPILAPNSIMHYLLYGQ